jgi:hypothetical protein
MSGEVDSSITMHLILSLISSIRFARAACFFARAACGKLVTIVEPYLKIGLDGLTFVRVDDPATEVDGVFACDARI